MMRKILKFLTDRTGMVFESLGLVVVSTVAFQYACRENAFQKRQQ